MKIISRIQCTSTEAIRTSEAPQPSYGLSTSVRKILPITYLPITYLPIYLFTYYLFTYYLFTYLPITYLPITYYLFTYKILPITYLKYYLEVLSSKYGTLWTYKRAKIVDFVLLFISLMFKY